MKSKHTNSKIWFLHKGSWGLSWTLRMTGVEWEKGWQINKGGSEKLFLDNTTWGNIKEILIIYPFVRRQISPVWRRSPVSSHIEMLMLPVLSATLTDLTSWPSLVRVGAPANYKMHEYYHYWKRLPRRALTKFY